MLLHRKQGEEMPGEMPQETVSSLTPTTTRPKVRENKGLTPNWYAHPFAWLPPAARPFCPAVKLIPLPQGLFAYRYVSARTRLPPDALVQKDGQPALSPLGHTAYRPGLRLR